jgi:3',5'-cyclic AMP phosphodiesterase CpdA
LRIARNILFPFIIAAMMAVLLSFSSCSRSNGETQGTSGQESQASHNSFSFLVCGDPHGRVDLLGRIIDQARPGEFLVIVGDMTTGTGLQEMKKMKDFLDSRELPYHVIPGDNDMPKGDRSTFEIVFGPDHYSFDVQDSHLVFLDDAVPGIGCPADQLTWLQQDLDSVPEKLIIAFAHVPAGAPLQMSDTEKMDREVGSGRQMLAILREAGAQVLYSGHLHAYMVYSDGPPRIIVTGGAGASPHLSEENGGYHHFLRVTVQDDQVTEEVIRL